MLVGKMLLCYAIGYIMEQQDIVVYPQVFILSLVQQYHDLQMLYIFYQMIMNGINLHSIHHRSQDITYMLLKVIANHVLYPPVDVEVLVL